MQIEQTVQKEIMRIAKGTILGTILMYIGFGIGHFALPELIPLDYRVIHFCLRRGWKWLTYQLCELRALLVRARQAAEKEERAEDA